MKKKILIKVLVIIKVTFTHLLINNKKINFSKTTKLQRTFSKWLEVICYCILAKTVIKNQYAAEMEQHLQAQWFDREQVLK